MHKLKVFLWRGKEFLKDLFRYPVKNISRDEKIDYDSYWEERAGKGDLNSLNSWQKKRADLVIEHIKNNQNISIADVASGSGNILQYIKSKVNLSKAVAYDLSHSSVAEAKRNGLDANILDLSDKDKLFSIAKEDYFLLFEILEHLANAEIVLNEFFEKSDKGVFVSVPNTGYLRHRLRLLLGRFPLQWRVYPNEHLRFWTLKDMEWWLSAQGYRNVKIIPYMGVPLLSRIWPNLFAAGIFVFLPKKVS